MTRLQYRKKLLFKTFGILFGNVSDSSNGEDSGDGEKDKGGYTIADSENENIVKVRKKWRWYDFLIGLTKDNPLELQRAMDYDFYDSCVYYLYKKEMK